MSWSLFKQNIKNVEDHPENIKSVNQIAHLYATEYDAAIKRGGDLVNHIPIMTGNVGALESMMLLALNSGLNSQGTYNLVHQMGPGIILYWTGATMMTAPVPITPAIGAIVNTACTAGICNNPGQWNEVQPPPQPADSTSPMVDQFIAYAKIHLTTIGGMFNTISLYPPLASPGPGVVMWNGYMVP